MFNEGAIFDSLFDRCDPNDVDLESDPRGEYPFAWLEAFEIPIDVENALNRQDCGDWPNDQQWESSLGPWDPEPYEPEDLIVARDPQIEDYLL